MHHNSRTIFSTLLDHEVTSKSLASDMLVSVTQKICIQEPSQYPYTNSATNLPYGLRKLKITT